MARIPRRLAGIGASDLSDNTEFDAYVGPAREVTVDPARAIIALHDGVTAGGHQFHAITVFVSKVDIGGNGDFVDVATRRFGSFVTNTSGEENEPQIWFVRKTSHTTEYNPSPGARNPSHVGRALGVTVQVLSDVQSFEFGSSLTLAEHVPLTTNQDLVGAHVAFNRLVGAAGTIGNGWALNAELKDLTGLKSSLSGGSLRGAEISIKAADVDDSAIRIIVDAVAFKLDTYAGVNTSFAYGYRIVNAGFYGAHFGATTIDVAFAAEGSDPYSSGSKINTGLKANVAGIGVLVNGAAATGVLIGETTNQAIVELGSINTLAASGIVRFTSRNSAVARKTIATIDAGMVVATPGAEVGRASINVMSAGVLVEAIAIYPAADASNPLFIYVNGALKKVTVGAIDTAGAGFRALRVPN